MQTVVFHTLQSISELSSSFPILIFRTEAFEGLKNARLSFETLSESAQGE
jgi:hypothetical protein